MAKTIAGGLIAIFALLVLLAIVLTYYPVTPFSSSTNSQSTDPKIQTVATPLQNVTDITTSVNSQNSSAGLYFMGLIIVVMLCIAGFIIYTAYNEWKDQKGRQ